MRTSTLLPFLFLLTVAAAGRAQVEYNPYVGLFSGDNRIELLGPTDGVDVYEGPRYAFGADFLFGAGQLAPSAGILFRPGRYESTTAASFTRHRLHLPLGLAYRVIAPDWDINLVPSLAVVPGLILGDGVGEERRLDWGARAGIRLYLDWATVGVHYFRGFGDPLPEGEHEEGRMLYTIGLRF